MSCDSFAPVTPAAAASCYSFTQCAACCALTPDTIKPDDEWVQLIAEAAAKLAIDNCVPSEMLGAMSPHWFAETQMAIAEKIGEVIAHDLEEAMHNPA